MVGGWVCGVQVEWADTEIKEIQQAIRNTEDTVEIQLDLLRNRIMRFELVLNIISAVLAVGACVTGERADGGWTTHDEWHW